MTDLLREALARFEEVFARAGETEASEPTAVILATADGEGRPSARTVLLKGVDERGFVFYTNYTSRKAREMEENPRGSFALHWPVSERQVRVEGTIQRIPPEESDAYFDTRPRESRLRVVGLSSASRGGIASSSSANPGTGIPRALLRMLGAG